MTSEEARALTQKSKNGAEEELEAVHSIIRGVSILGCRQFKIDKRLFNPRTLKLLEEEKRVLEPSKIEDDWFCITWI